MTTAAAVTPRRRSLYARGMAVGLAGGVVAIAFAALTVGYLGDYHHSTLLLGPS